jgi:Bacterial capsule synthesis protein PGA_cap
VYRRQALLGLVGAAATAALTNRARAAAGAHTATINLLGDCILTTPLPREDADLARILPILRGADVTVANFEGTLADSGSWANSIVCGGQNVRGVESTVGDLGWLGVKLVGNANNHGMDWGAAGLLATARKLSAAGIAHAGTGENLAEARKPAYLASAAGTVALISCASTYRPGALASHANTTVPGRPGISPVRVQKQGVVDVVDTRDLDEIVASVSDARGAADVVIVSCHTHEEGGDRAKPPAFLEQLAHACVDAGAHTFFSHGPHVLRGVEIYRGRPIFYSLGAFLFLTRDSRQLPEESYENCGITSRNPLDYYEKTDKEWLDDIEFWEGAIARITLANGRIERVALVPTVIRHDAAASSWGVPRLATTEESARILRRLETLSGQWGTRIDVGQSAGRVVV